MIGGLIGSVFLRQAPDALVIGLRTGEYQVFGSLIKSTLDGRIVGHLQEAGGLGKLAGLVGSGPLAPVKLLTEGVKIVQNEQIKAGIGQLQAEMATLQHLQVAGLALGAAGIGVSVVGFAILGRKIDRVREDISALGDRIDLASAEAKAVRRDLVEADLRKLKSLSEAMDEGWLLSPASAERQWHGVAEEASYLAIAFEQRSGRLLDNGATGLPEAEPMLDALSLAAGLHVAARAAAGEERAAHAAVAKGARAVETLTGRLGVADLAREQVRVWSVEPGTAEWGHALGRATETARPIVSVMREREAAAATRGATLSEMDRRGVRARDWMEAARDAQDSEVLVMQPLEAR